MIGGEIKSIEISSVSKQTNQFVVFNLHQSYYELSLQRYLSSCKYLRNIGNSENITKPFILVYF